MPIAVRLLLALGLLALFVTALVGFSARKVARREVERGFAARIASATTGARDEVVREATNLSKLLTPLCKHDSIVDRTLVELERAEWSPQEIDAGRSIAIQELVSEQQKALRLDELMLVTGDGFVLAAGDRRQVGQRQAPLATLLRQGGGTARLAEWRGQASLVLHCSRRGAGGSLALVGYRRVAPILERVGGAYGVDLALSSPASASAEATDLADDAPLMRQRLVIAQIPGLEVTATISREPLFEALRQMDRSILLAGGIAVLLSIALAVFIAGGLSRPIVELAQQTREVVRGKPRPVRARGGRELAELARSFNRTIDELAAMRRRVAATERIAARREMARQIAHEIKNPLAPIRAAVETLRRLRQRQAPQFDEYFEEATATVLTEVHRISDIVTEFTKFARMPPPKFERVDLAAVAQSVIALHDGKGITGAPRVRLDAEPVPDVLADRDQLVQVLTNLVQNGIEAARTLSDPPVLPRIEVTIGRASDHTVRVEVIDNGPGVDPAIRERLFEPYASTKREGTGLGLAIAQRIVYEHGGEIRCEDATGGGARFVVVLPIDGPPLLERPPDSVSGTPPPVAARSE